MTIERARRKPGWWEVVIEQIITIGYMLRWAALMALGTCVLLICVATKLSFNVRDKIAAGSRESIDLSFTPQISMVLAVVAILVPLMVWQDEDISRRTYHRAMPVSQSRHALSKVFAGWCLLLLVTTLFVVTAWLSHFVSESIVGQPQPYHTGFVWWEWLVPYTSVSVAYLLSSAAAVGTRRPIAWFAAIPGLYFVVGGLADALGYDRIVYTLTTFSREGYGVSAAFGGDITRYSDGFRRYSSTYPSVERWLGAALLWSAVGSLLLWWAARRRYEVS